MSHSSKALQQREARDNSKAQKAEIEALQNKLAASEAREKETQQLLKEALEKIEYLTRKLFGRSTEARVVDGQLTMDILNEVEVITDKDPLEQAYETELVQFERKKKPKKTIEEKLKGLPVKKRVITMPEAERVCESCGAQMKSAGEKFIRRELVYVPAKLYVREIYAESYYCPKCKNEAANPDSDVKNSVKTTPVPGALIPGSMATESVVAHSIYEKYANAVPLYRQEKDWQQIGTFLTRARLASWINVCSEEYFAPIYDYFHKLLLGREFAMADETRLQVLKEPERDAETNSFMWLFRSGEDGLPPMILYHYTETRAKFNAVAFLKGWIPYDRWVSRLQRLAWDHTPLLLGACSQGLFRCHSHGSEGESIASRSSGAYVLRQAVRRRALLPRTWLHGRATVRVPSKTRQVDSGGILGVA